MKKTKSGISTLYELRKSFTVIGLTGREGAGTNKAAKILSTPQFDDVGLRRPEEIIINIDDKTDCKPNNHLVFYKKYKICHDFAKMNWFPYKRLRYRDAILLHLVFLSKDKIIKEVLEQDHFKTYDKLKDELEGLLDDPIIEKIKNHIEDRNELLEIRDDRLKNYAKIFFGEKGFEGFADKFYSLLDKYDIYKRKLFLHRLSNYLRGSGKPNRNWEQKYRYENFDNLSNIYTVSKTINRLIKAWREISPDTHIVIDSLKNSLEILFFKERYSAFYMASVSSDYRRENFEEKYNKKQNPQELISNIFDLDNIEYKTGDFKAGRFWAPDVENCVQKSDIHLINNNYYRDKKGRSVFKEKNKYGLNNFDSLEEQLLKVVSLIQQPGLITPSAIERCMQIAYNAKYNSGCLSRQVGAIVTDNTFSVKSIGWNDVAKGKVPCKLRDIRELKGGQKSYGEEIMFSPFELGIYKQDVKSRGFQKKLDYISINEKSDFSGTGKPFPYCFKDIYNAYDGEANQVHTRSLHAEENAMLQIAKHGGMGLNGGNLFTTASPCELCSKKAFQLGIKNIYYIDPYPGISKRHIIEGDVNSAKPQMKLFFGAIGRAFHKLYEPFISYKDELFLETGFKPELNYGKLLEKMVAQIDDEKALTEKIKELQTQGKIDRAFIEKMVEQAIIDQENAKSKK